MKANGHGWIRPLKIITGVLVAAWLPVRLVFLEKVLTENGGSLDKGFEVFVCFLVVGPYFLLLFNSRSRTDEKHKNLSWKVITSLLLDLAVSVPVVSIAAGLGNDHMPIWWLLPKIILLRHISQIKKLLEFYDNLHPVMQRLLPIAFVMPTVVHLAACGWVWLGAGTMGLSGNAWEDYVKSLYYVMTTFTTVGYGDIAPKTLPQMAYAMVTQLVGIGFFGFVVSNVASLLARMDAARENHLSMLDRVEAFMSHNELPRNLRLKVRSYYRYLWDTRHGYDDNEILSDLPNKLKSEVSLCLNAEIIDKVPLFKGADLSMIEDIVLQLRSIVAVPGEKIFDVGVPGDAMYFIHQGSVEILTADESVLATLHPGSFFGEMALLTSNARSAMAKTVTYCDLFELSREAFEKVLERHPQFEKHIREIADKRESKMSEVNDSENHHKAS